MRADLGPLLHHHHGDVRIDLLEPDGGGEAGGAGADNNNIEFHRLAGGYLGHENLLALVLHSSGHHVSRHARMQ